ncbi:MAG: hypothetical protein ACOYXB_17770 [Bacteroidota bacterium]
MKTNRFIAFTAVIICLILSVPQGCGSAKKTAGSQLSFTSVSFGKKGGFTNQTEMYILRNNGQLLKMENGAEIDLGTVKKARLSEIDRQLSGCGFRELSFSETGNMTYFITVTYSEGSNTVNWTTGSDLPAIKELYSVLTSLLKI